MKVKNEKNNNEVKEFRRKRLIENNERMTRKKMNQKWKEKMKKKKNGKIFLKIGRKTH